MSAAVKLNLKPLRALIANVGALGGMKVKVGLLVNTAARTADPGRIDHNPSLGVVHEYGRGNNPERSFLRVPLEQHLGSEIDRMSEALMRKLLQRTNGPAAALKLLGVVAEEVIQDAFDTRGFGTWKEDHRDTITRKRRLGRSLAVLTETNQLRKAISSQVV